MLQPGDLPTARSALVGQEPADQPPLLDVIDPSTGEIISSVALGTEHDVDVAVAAAVVAQRAWQKLVPRQRSHVLHAVADRLVEQRQLLARLEAADTGKPMSVALNDIDVSVDAFRFMAGALRATSSVAAGEYEADHFSVIVREPLGVVGAITPWNFPLVMAAQKIATILAAGNSIVLKPSEITPLTTIKFAELVADLLPPGLLNVVTGLGNVVGAAIAAHPDIALVSVTGSTASGRAVARIAADSVKRVHLELGGKAPVIVFADADIERVADTLSVASFYNSGQDCSAACRVLVHESVADQLVRALVDRVNDISVGEPGAGEDIQLGPVVSEAHFRRVLDHLDRAYAEGARAAVGGSAYPGAGFFIQPTVLVDVPAGAACTREEIFGPVLTVETFSSDEEAIERANSVELGLSASVWTRDGSRGDAAAAQLDAGTVWVNCHGVIPSEMPWGGVKSSGYGRDMSMYGLDDYSRTKHLMRYVGR
nr:aldehyde dehydrogenase family protein [Microbacterium ureisolvens]